MRDFTFIDDIVEGIYLCCNKPQQLIKNLIQIAQILQLLLLLIRFNIEIQTNKFKRFYRFFENELGKKSSQEFCLTNWRCYFNLRRYTKTS